MCSIKIQHPHTLQSDHHKSPNSWGFPGGSDGKESTCNVGDPGLIPTSGRREVFDLQGWLPSPVFLPGEFHGQRSMVGYSPWDHKEFDTAERLTHTHTHTHTTVDPLPLFHPPNPLSLWCLQIWSLYLCTCFNFILFTHFGFFWIHVWDFPGGSDMYEQNHMVFVFLPLSYFT